MNTEKYLRNYIKICEETTQNFRVTNNIDFQDLVMDYGMKNSVYSRKYV